FVTLGMVAPIAVSFLKISCGRSMAGRAVRMVSERKSCLSGKGLTKVFGFGRNRTVAVDHVDFDFKEGEVVSIVGESGSGKTTLAKMLLGLVNPTEGEIYFQGQKRDIRS